MEELRAAAADTIGTGVLPFDDLVDSLHSVRLVTRTYQADIAVGQRSTTPAARSLTGARLHWAGFTIDLESVPDLAGVPRARARITVAPPARGRYQVSLAGLDLNDARVAATFDGPLLKVTSLDDAILDGTSLDRVDFSAIDTSVIDLSNVDVWNDESICPDGQPPDDLPIGTCVRAG